MKFSTGEATWELNYTDRWMDGRMDGWTDAVKLFSLSDKPIGAAPGRQYSKYSYILYLS
jgi:hypothetical protein